MRESVRVDDPQILGDGKDTGDSAFKARALASQALHGVATAVKVSPSSPVTDATSSLAGGESGFPRHAFFCSPIRRRRPSVEGK